MHLEAATAENPRRKEWREQTTLGLNNQSDDRESSEFTERNDGERNNNMFRFETKNSVDWGKSIGENVEAKTCQSSAMAGAPTK